jgi:large subunit ribosomal protein L13
MSVKQLSYKTKHANSSTVKREWHLIDAENKTLGRLATKAATLLMGKHKPSFTSHFDAGDYVVIINAEKVVMTGKKMDDKEIITYSGYPGGKKTATPREMQARQPERLIEYAIRGMLPKTRLGDKMYGKLHIYKGAEHPHKANNPKPVK